MRRVLNNNAILQCMLVGVIRVAKKNTKNEFDKGNQVCESDKKKDTPRRFEGTVAGDKKA